MIPITLWNDTPSGTQPAKRGFLELLKAHSIPASVGVRTMKIFLKGNGILYVHMKEPGGSTLEMPPLVNI